MSLIFVDTFTAGGFQIITAYDPTWVRHDLTTYTEFAVFDNMARWNANTGIALNLNTGHSPGSPDYAVECDLIPAALWPGNFYGICGRYLKTAFTGYLLGYNSVAANWELYRINAGVATLLGTAQPVSLSIGTRYRLRLKMVGAVITASVDGTNVCGTPVTDPSPITAQNYPGMYADIPSGVPYSISHDDFAIDDLAGVSSNYLQDDFNDTSGTALDVHAMDVGPGWVVAAGTPTIEGNKASIDTGEWIRSNATHSDVKASVQVTVPNSSAYKAGIVFRRSTTVGSYLIAQLTRIASGTPALEIWNNISGTVLATVAAPNVTNTTVGLSVVCNGTSITVALSTGEIVSVTSSVNQTETYFGLITTTGVFLFEDFIVEPPPTPPGSGFQVPWGQRSTILID